MQEIRSFFFNIATVKSVMSNKSKIGDGGNSGTVGVGEGSGVFTSKYTTASFEFE